MAKFNQAFFSQKAICKMFLREFGIARDWEKVKLSDMKAMLRSYSDEKLFTVAKLIMERDGLPYNQADYEDHAEEIAAMDDDQLAEELDLPEQVKEPVASPIEGGVAAFVEELKQAKREAEKQERDRKAAFEAEMNIKNQPKPEIIMNAEHIEADNAELKLAAQLAALIAGAKPKAPAIDQAAIKAMAHEVAMMVVNEKTTAMVDSMKKQMVEIANIAANNVAPREIIIRGDDFKEVKINGVVHPVFEKVMRLAKAGLNVLLVGPAGCGKTHLAAQVAQALGKSFASISGSAGVSEAQLTGRLLPTGDGGRFEYHESPFVREYSKENGGFLFDEIDAFDPNCLLTVNQATANNGFEIEARGVTGKGTYVAKGKGSLIFGAANTFGSGADMQYVGRAQLDGATLDRWYVVSMDYNAALESQLSGMPCPPVQVWRPAGAPSQDEIISIGEWVTDLRQRATANKLRRIVSTRMLQKAIAARTAGIPIKEIKADLTAGWSRDELAKVGM